MKADTHPTGSTAVATNPPTDYLKPVLTSANAGLSVPGGPPPPGPELALNVECGPNKAWFYVGRLCQGSKGPCVLFNGAWLTPNEFQYVSGRETAKDWKRSIRHHGKSMKLLMTKGILAIAPPSCQCDVCTGCAENNNNLVSCSFYSYKLLISALIIFTKLRETFCTYGESLDYRSGFGIFFRRLWSWTTVVLGI